MEITFFNNWYTLDEFIFIDFRLMGYQDSKQFGVSMAILGVGFVIIFNLQ